jgi:exonuclease SbcC
VESCDKTPTQSLTKKPHPVHVRIQSFQSIKDVDFVVHGFTVITGPTNVGKSAVLRAVTRAILNNPVVGMVRKGSKYCTVEINSDGWGFKWEKGERDINRYVINETVYDKTGQTQLSQIEAMGFGSINVGDDRLSPWTADQYNPIFLLNRPGPQVTGFISEVSHLEVVQNAIVLAARGKRRYQDEAKAKETALAANQTRANKLKPLEILNRVQTELEQQRASIDDYEARIASMSYMLQNIQSLNIIIALFHPMRSIRIPDFEIVNQNLTKMREMRARQDVLQSAAEQVLPLRKVKDVIVIEPPEAEYQNLKRLQGFAKVKKSQKTVDVLSQIENMNELLLPECNLQDLRKMQAIQDSLAAATKLCTLFAHIHEIAVPKMGSLPLAEIQAHITTIGTIRNEEAAVKKELDQAANELETVERELAAIPICPFCKRPIAQVDDSSCCD